MNPASKRNLRILLAPLAALVAFTLTTCTEPVSIQCPTGVVCPAGKKCAASQPVCIVENCGDGVKQDGEVCDDGNIVSGDGCSADCLSDESCGNGKVDTFLVTDPATGAQKPKEACDDGNSVDGDGCSKDCQSNELCGNGIVDSQVGEICDDGNKAFGDGCSGDCLSNETCGNGYCDVRLEGDKKEACDDGNNEVGDGCTPDCKSKEECGNGYVDFNEACDDGNRTSGDGCSADCRSDEKCGNGYTDTFIDPATGKAKEVCDDGNTLSGDGCSDTCKSKEECGNDILDPVRINPETGATETLEVCDDGNRADGDGCSKDCKSTELCGNGYVDSAKGELCDDGNSESGDGCSSDCRSTEFCGNGAVDRFKRNPQTGALEPFEVCDDGNNVSGDGCSANCKSNETCGNGIIDVAKGETCDDGNTLDGDGCAGNCRSTESCGNGVIDAAKGETCDDQNNSLNDDCIHCQVAFCGDGFTNLTTDPATSRPKEQCDTAGFSATCNSNCTLSRCGDGIVNPAAGEQCDTSGESASCDSDCTAAFCGDGKTNPTRGEQCDDAGPSARCNANCTASSCGDGVLNTAAGEQCDPGTVGQTRYCDSDCSPSACGDGLVNTAAGEGCDDGNTNNNDACRNDCQPNLCGDGIVNSAINTATGAAFEACDDANTINETSCPYGQASCTTCNSTCTAELHLSGAVCGDGANNGSEVCDDGNTVTETECPYGTPTCVKCDSSCRTVLNLTGRYCGDAQQTDGEACDDGNAVSETSCPYGQASCRLCNATCSAELSLSGPYCGDGVKNGTEICDDHNTVTESSCPYGTPTCVKCDSSCRTVLNLTGRYCGDALQTDGEACDDGNTANETACPYGQTACAPCNATCTGTLSGLPVSYCGDGTQNGPEDCDDGNTVDETACAYGTKTCSGCAADCKATLSLVGPYCGDNIKNGTETCDDGDTETEAACEYGQSTCTLCRADCGEVLDLRGPYCGDGTRNGLEACDDENASCGSCNVGCTGFELVAASGTITVNGTGGLNGYTFTLSDGVNAPVTFEYDANHAVSAGNVEVYIKNQNSNQVAAITSSAINSTAKPLNLTASVSNNVVTLVNEQAGVIGNQAIQKTITATTWVGSGMAGGKGRDCAQGQACRYPDDCSAGLVCDALSKTCELPSFGVSVALAGNGGGSVTSADTHLDCGATCNFAYQSGEVVVLTATPHAHSDFAGWSGGCTGTETTCEIVVSAATSVTATFTAKVYTLTAAKAGLGIGTVTSEVGGINCGSTCTADLEALTLVTLTATPNSTSSFAGWSEPGCPGTGTTCTVTLDASKTVTATFNEVRHPLGVTKAGDGTGSVSSSPAGINCGSDCEESYLVNTSVTLTATATAGSSFTGWTGAGCSGTGTCVVAVNAAKSVTATFKKLFDFTVTTSGLGTGTVASNPAGTSCGAGCQTYLSGTVVTLTPAAQAGSAFAGWTGACSGMGSCSVTMDAEKSVGAIFEEAYTLTVTTTAGGVVSSVPAGIDCGSVLNDCSEEYLTGAAVSLTAFADTGMIFTGWSGACSGTGTCTVAMTAAQSVGATFAAGFALTVTRAGTGTGTVTSAPAGIDCGESCTASFAEAGSVVLTAVASAGSVFMGWSDSGCPGTGTCTVTMDAAKSVTATFALLNRLTVTSGGSGTGVVASAPAGIDCGSTCLFDFASSVSVTLTATATSPSVFGGWSGDCTGTGTCVVAMGAVRTVSATFTLCGDSKVEGLEGCDDANTSADDGCSAACAVETGFTCSGAPSACYPVITVDGTKEAAWTKAVVGVDSSSAGNSMLPDDLISNVRVTNDATNLYVGVEAFGDSWVDGKPAHLHLYFIKNGEAGSVSADDWASTVTFTGTSHQPSYIGHLWFNGETPATDRGGVVTTAAATTGFAELRIPLAGLGTLVKGDTVGLIVGYRPDDVKIGFSDIAPYKASAVSDYGNTASAVDPTAAQYFSYTVR